jgi:hypothetical protein
MAMNISSPRSRRSLLRAALGGIAGAAAATLTGAQRVLAAGGDDGSTMHVGEAFFDAQTTTRLSNSANDSTVFAAEGAAGPGIYGRSY